jgi:hypothetical protein
MLFAEMEHVISVEFHDYDGLVYTLETDIQMYDINGFIAKNCRCTQGFFAARDLNGKLIPKKTKGITILHKLNLAA